MPTLRIVSVYRQNKRKYAFELAQARAELERFKASLAARFGTETAAAVRRQVLLTEGEAPKLSPEGAAAVKELRALLRKVMAVRKKIRAADCWFHESPGSVSALDAVGLSWHVVNERCSDDGRLPLSGALWLLRALLAPGRLRRKKGGSGAGGQGLAPRRLPEKWRRLLRRRRRRLASSSARRQCWRKTCSGGSVCSRGLRSRAHSMRSMSCRPGSGGMAPPCRTRSASPQTPQDARERRMPSISSSCRFISSR